MASEEMSLVSARRVDDGLNPQLVFHENSFSCVPPPSGRVGSASGDPGPKTTRELTGFIDKYDNHYFHHQHPAQAADFRRQMFGEDRRDGDWNTKSHGDGDGSEDDDVDEDDEDDEDENEVEGIVTVENSNQNNSNSDKVNSNTSSKVVGSDKTESLSTFGKFFDDLLFSCFGIEILFLID